MDCCSPGDSPFDRQFDSHIAAEELRTYRDKGAVGLTRELIEALAEGGLDGRTVLEIGGGVGAIHHELLHRRGGQGGGRGRLSRLHLGCP